MITFKNVSFAYKTKGNGEKTIDNLSFDIKDFGITAIIAPSGMGKTTILKLISGLIKPDSGEIKIDKENVKISYVFQEDRLLPWENVIDNLKSTCKNVSEGEIKLLLEELNITDDLFNKRPGELSGGQKQRVCLARALLFDGDILLLDEPFTGLDKDNREIVLNKIIDFSKNKPVVLVSHIEEDINIANNIIKL